MICRHSGFMTCLTIDLFHHLTIQDSSRGNVKVIHILLVHIMSHSTFNDILGMKCKLKKYMTCVNF